MSVINEEPPIKNRTKDARDPISGFEIHIVS